VNRVETATLPMAPRCTDGWAVGADGDLVTYDVQNAVPHEFGPDRSARPEQRPERGLREQVQEHAHLQRETQGARARPVGAGRCASW
jgi:hypothetical protein